MTIGDIRVAAYQPQIRTQPQGGGQASQPSFQSAGTAKSGPVQPVEAPQAVTSTQREAAESNPQTVRNAYSGGDGRGQQVDIYV